MAELRELPGAVSRSARDVAYVAIGFGVLGVQRAQVRRQELAKRLAEPAGALEHKLVDVRGGLARQAKVVDETVEQAIDQLEARWEPVEERLPEPARELSHQMRARSRDAREQIRVLLIDPPA